MDHFSRLVEEETRKRLHAIENMLMAAMVLGCGVLVTYEGLDCTIEASNTVPFGQVYYKREGFTWA